MTDARLVVLGSGEPRYERFFQQAERDFPRQVRFRNAYDEDLAHRIEAGTDVFLMPSVYEPCGLNQMYSLKYGTPPIVRAVGGLDDTIENFDRSTKRGNGFKFYDYDSTRLLEKIYEALMVYADRDLWRTLMLTGMRADHSWNHQAQEYVDLYLRLVRRGASAT